MVAEEDVSVFSKVNDDILLNILVRLPAAAFACASCVSRTWHENCGQILNHPKFLSAMSMNPVPCEAVDEVFDAVFSQAIRPDFVIVYIGMEFSLPLTSLFVFKKMPRGVPIIINQAVGLFGVEMDSDEIMEVKWDVGNGGNYWCAENLMGGNPVNGGIILYVGFLPDLKVDVIPLLRSKTANTHIMEAPNMPLMDYFLMEIRSFTSLYVAGLDPACITMFGDHRVDIRPIVEKLDSVTPDEVAIVGDANGSFLFRRRDETQNYNSDVFLFDAVALVFARDQNKSDEWGETQFHVAVSDGIIPFGPELRSLQVVEDLKYFYFWRSARSRTRRYPMLDCVAVLQHLIDQLELDNPDFYIEVSKRRRPTTTTPETAAKTQLALHELLGGNNESIIVNGLGIRPGDRFLFLHSDAETALTRVDNACESMEALDAAEEIFGALIFSSYRRNQLGNPCLDASPFTDKLNGVPVAGISCTREIGLGALLGQGLGYFLRAHSCVYLPMSYIPLIGYQGIQDWRLIEGVCFP